MRGRDVLRPTHDKERPWDPARDTHIARIIWEDIEPDNHGGCTMRMRWRMKPSIKDKAGE